MNVLASPISGRTKWLAPVAFAAGCVVLLGAWALVYWTESMFTESHLVGYYCCVTETDLPESGTLERTLSDFFQASPGKHLVSLLFVGASIALFTFNLRRRRRLVWWLPWLFVLLTIIYVQADFELMAFSWSLSNRFVGTRTTAYAGYERTWYGIALHFMLWAVFFAVASALLWRLLPRSQAASRTRTS